MDFKDSSTPSSVFQGPSAPTNSAEPWHPRLGAMVESAWSKDSHKNLHVIGTTSYTLAAGMVADSLPWDEGRVRLVVVPTEEDVSRIVEGLQFFSPSSQVFPLPGFDVSPYSNLYPNPRLAAQRVRWMAAASSGSLVISRMI